MLDGKYEKNCNMRKNALLLFIVVSVLTVIYSYHENLDNPYLPIAISVCIELVAYYIANKAIKLKLFSLSTLFVTLVFLFHFGQLLLITFFPDVIELYSFRIVVNFFSDAQACYALKIMNIAFVAIAFGTLLPSKRYKATHMSNINIDYYQLAKKIILLTFPFKVIIDLLTVYYSFTIGFSQTSLWLQSVPNFIRSFGKISMVGFAILMVSLSTKPQKQKKVFIFVLVYLAVLMLSGWRSENIAFLTVFAYLFLSTRPSIKLKNVIIYAVAGYFMLCFVQVVADMRTSSGRSIAGYSDMLSTMLFGGGLVIFDSLRELGNTGYTAECVLINWLSRFDPSWGKSYILGLTAILPNITGLSGKLTESAAFATQLQQHNMVLSEYVNIGGSVLGEFFFNFGVIGGIIFAFIVGKIIGWFSDNANRCLIGGDYSFLIIAIPVMFASLYWVRDSFGHLIRDVVWAILLSLIILKSMRHKQIVNV